MQRIYFGTLNLYKVFSPFLYKKQHIIVYFLDFYG
jgi:hypothetical protein